MSKLLPVYDLGKWVRSDRNIGYIVARMSAANVWEVRDDYANRKDVERFMGRGAGYVIQWVEPRYADDATWFGDPPPPIGVDPYRLSWLRAETIAEKRYQPCDNPVKAPIASEYVSALGINGAEVIDESQSVGPSQPTLPLDIEAATEATMRAAVALGNQAADWLRAKGLTL
jgi:hypothetical protein